MVSYSCERDLRTDSDYQPAANTTHASRTLMFSELSHLLEFVPQGATFADYRDAVLSENILMKETQENRRKAYRHLKNLYEFDSSNVLFKSFRYFWDADPDARAQLAIIYAVFSDILLRSTAEFILSKEKGQVVSPAELSAIISTTFPERYSERSRESIGRNCASSWTQSGHLKGQVKKVRGKPTLTVGGTAFALLLGDMTGVRGEPLFSTMWAKLLDADRAELDEVTFYANKRGWLRYKHIGSVVEISFRDLFSYLGS